MRALKQRPHQRRRRAAPARPQIGLLQSGFEIFDETPCDFRRGLDDAVMGVAECDEGLAEGFLDGFGGGVVVEGVGEEAVVDVDAEDGGVAFVRGVGEVVDAD